MNKILDDFQMVIASTNGSGTLTSNRVLHKALFRHGYNVVGKNLFPSNIEGLPTYYFLRVSKSSQSLKTSNELYVALNPTTYSRDLTTLVNAETVVLLNSDLKLNPPQVSINTSGDKLDDKSKTKLDVELNNYELSFKQTVKSSKAPIKVKKRMSNMSYVGWLGCYLNLDVQIMKDVIATQFSNPDIIEENIQVMLEGWNSCMQVMVDKDSDTSTKNNDHATEKNNSEATTIKFDDSIKNKSDSEILIEGNQASALGWVDGGCTVATWYPITPSTSLVESFETYAKSLRPDISNVAVVQSEDEISAIASVVGAGWAGSRAATATSGPGLSLMSEALGLAYFAEVPAVVCDVQRVGPSTGLPTRTSQGDLEFAYKISHGDTFHPVLLPSNPYECYSLSAQAFDVADKYQTPVFVLTDLDLGMNLWTSESLALNPSDHSQEFERSQILSETDLENLEAQNKTFKRYDGDENGIPFRTLPGTHHPKAAYFTRGSGHNEAAGYSEHPEDYEKIMLRLQKKVLSARQDLPEPLISFSDSAQTEQADPTKVGVIYYGTTAQVFPELFSLLPFEINTCQVMALPLHDQVYDFINDHDVVFVVEQNRDGQLKNIIKQSDQNTEAQQLHSILHFDGWSIQADKVAEKILKAMTVLKLSSINPSTKSSNTSRTL